MSEAHERTSALQSLRRHAGVDADLIARAPGRVNLIGEHTDYNDGFVLPMALPHATWMAARRRDDGRIRLWSEGHPAAELSIATLDERVDGWPVYVQGVARMLAEEGTSIRGFDAALATDIPVGASLSSSAALELVTARVMTAYADAEWDPVAGALASVRAEREHVGMPCGVMDQLISSTATAGHASLIDCRTLETDPVPLPSDTAVVVLDTGTRRQLVDSAYAERRAACERVAEALGVRALRDTTVGSDRRCTRSGCQRPAAGPLRGGGEPPHTRCRRRDASRRRCHAGPTDGRESRRPARRVRGERSGAGRHGGCGDGGTRVRWAPA